MNLEIIVIVGLAIMAVYGLVVSNALAKEVEELQPQEINKAIEEGKKIGSDAADIVNEEFNKKGQDDGEEQTDKINKQADKESSKKCDAKCEEETAAKEDYIYDEPGKEKPYPGDKDKKVGNDLTIILKLKYSNLPAKYFKKVEISVGKYFGKFYNLSDKPGKVTIKHLKIPEGRVFNVHVNNYLTDEGEQVRMHNSVCKCPETSSIRVP